MQVWFKSSQSVAGHSCVEVCFDGPDTLVRDTKHNGRGPELRFTADEWSAFLIGAMRNEFVNPNAPHTKLEG